MAQPEKVDYSTLEVDERGQNLPEVKPETDLPEVKPGTDPPEVWRPNTDLPEAFDQTGKEVAAPAYARKRTWNRILPLRRKTIWSLLAAALLLITGAAVGAGVGATRKSSTAATHDAAADTASRRGILPTTSLAAANYTDHNGEPHTQLYYQARSLQILMADRSASSPTWTLSAVLPANNRTAIAPKNATPIAAYNWWWSDNSNTSDFRCLFLDAANAVRSLWAPDRGASGWRTADVLDAILTAADASQLVEHTVQCEGCDRSDFTGYQAAGADGELLLYYPFGNGVSGRFLPGGVVADGGTAMAVAPVPGAGNGTAGVALYLAAAGRLVELYGAADAAWNGTNMTTGQGDVPMDDGAKIAAISQIRGDSLNKQVLMTGTGSGVRMAYFNGTAWYYVDSVAGMESVLPLSPIAATQTGRVYALEDGPQIIEWNLVEGDTPTFERVGIVNGTES